MKGPRLSRPVCALPVLLAALLGLLALCAAPALANDFFPPSPVPSSRDSVKPKATATKESKTQVNSNVLNNKIVKTTKATGGTGTSPTGKTPGAL
ncbi:MAG TPA: hypothetical protein VN419_02685 [Humidesulfovibrio sp.]|uniref:hypothetical protein n=1 Tax=Humidesulfovibrio sp. TaxID=2910988 RepID=UPI002C4EE4C0|nr:hypothetical protein [Humidesulfovibrio sp.]HWR02902.1 hypothetical protein [Humidesulfovibrio sp.]